MYMNNIHELLRISVYGGIQVRIHFCTTLTEMGRMQEVGHSWFMINIVTLNLKLAYQGGTNVSPLSTRPLYSCKEVLYRRFCITAYGGERVK